jgi:hypothetical protein
MSKYVGRVSLFSLIALAVCLGAGCKVTSPRHSDSAKAQPQASAATPTRVRPAEAEILAKAIQEPPAPFEGEGWQRLFDGKSLHGWKETDFAGHGEIASTNGLLIMNMGDPFTGVNLTNPFPKMNYELALDAMRVNGSDFFCGITMPIGETFCSLIVGGWGGSLFGISSLDGMDASENETTRFMNFERGKWYRIRIRVTEGRIEGWLDKEKLVDVVTTDKKISLRPGDIELSKPFGIACWQTTAALREIKFRSVSKAADPPKKHSF